MCVQLLYMPRQGMEHLTFMIGRGEFMPFCNCTLFGCVLYKLSLLRYNHSKSPLKLISLLQLECAQPSVAVAAIAAVIVFAVHMCALPNHRHMQHIKKYLIPHKMNTFICLFAVCLLFFSPFCTLSSVWHTHGLHSQRSQCT